MPGPILTAILTAATLTGSQITLTWDRNHSSQVTYKVYEGVQSGIYTKSHQAGTNNIITLPFTASEGESIYYSVTASLESDFSNEVSATKAVPKCKDCHS